MPTPIWTFNEALIRIFASDELGTLPTPGQDPILSYCYVEGGSINGNMEVERRQRDCQDDRELVTVAGWDTYSASVNGIYVKKELELNVADIFNHTKWLVVEFLCQSLAGPTYKATDSHSLSKCKATAFALSGRDNDNLVYNASFEATTFT